MESTQGRSLRDKLREAGCEVVNYGAPRGEMIIYMIRREGKKNVPIIVNDLGEDGYVLRVTPETTTVDQDVAMILKMGDE